MSETKVSRILTREAVEAGNPCYEYSSKFAERFPESVEVTVELAVSQAEDWDWYWAANALLGYTGRAAWSTATDVAERQYDDTTRPYQDAMDKVYEEYQQVYDRVIREGHELGLGWGVQYRAAELAAAPIVEIERAALKAARGVAGKRLNEARARAWAEIYISETDEQTATSTKSVVDYDGDDAPCNCYSCREDRNSW